MQWWQPRLQLDHLEDFGMVASTAFLFFSSCGPQIAGGDGTLVQQVQLPSLSGHSPLMLTAHLASDIGSGYTSLSVTADY